MTADEALDLVASSARQAALDMPRPMISTTAGASEAP